MSATAGLMRAAALALLAGARARKTNHTQPRLLLIIGVQLLDETKPHMEQLAAATENSKFIDASGGIDSLNDAFEEVAELIAE